MYGYEALFVRMMHLILDSNPFFILPMRPGLIGQLLKDFKGLRRQAHSSVRALIYWSRIPSSRLASYLSKRQLDSIRNAFLPDLKQFTLPSPIYAILQRIHIPYHT